MKSPRHLAWLVMGVLWLAPRPVYSQNYITVVLPDPYPHPSQRETNLYVVVTTGPLQPQSLVAQIEDRTVALSFSTSAFTNNAGPQPGWAGYLNLSGLTTGSKTLTINLTDELGNLYYKEAPYFYDGDLPPSLVISQPPDSFVVRSNVPVLVSANDDISPGTRIEVYGSRDGMSVELLASGTNNLSTNVSLASLPGYLDYSSIVELRILATDNSGHVVGRSIQLYTQASTNLVAVDSVSEGRILDLNTESILFSRISYPSSLYLGLSFTRADWEATLKKRSRSTGLESIIYGPTNVIIPSAHLTPNGALLSSYRVPEGYDQAQDFRLFQIKNNAEVNYESPSPYPFHLITAANYAAWSPTYSTNGQIAQLGLINLVTATATTVSNIESFYFVDYDIAENGDLVFRLSGGLPNPGIQRYHDGNITLLATNYSPAEAWDSPRSDGVNVYFRRPSPVGQQLVRISGAAQVVVAEAALIDPDFQINNGWLAYVIVVGNQVQLWRQSPEQIKTLLYQGADCNLEALAPNGEVAFYGSESLYIANGRGSPQFIVAGVPRPKTMEFDFYPTLKLYWLADRWYVTLGRTLFQVYTGAPKLVPQKSEPNKIRLDLIGAIGQRLVTESSTNLVNWQSIATNTIADGGSLTVQDNLDQKVARKFYRLRSQ